jgi:hypothetical protein
MKSSRLAQNYLANIEARRAHDQARSQRLRVDREIHAASYSQDWPSRRGGRLPRIPMRWRRQKLVSRRFFTHTNLLHVAARDFGLQNIPPRFIAGKYLCGRGGIFGGTVYHLAAYHGCLPMIPRHLLTENNLLTTDDDDCETVFHYAARGGHLSHLPPECLTFDSLCLKSMYGITVAHWAVQRGAEQVPLGLLTPQLLFLTNDLGETVLSCAAMAGTLREIPATPALANRYSELVAILQPSALRRQFASEESAEDLEKRAALWLSKVAKLRLKPALGS